jgi:hypothetical protein
MPTYGNINVDTVTTSTQQGILGAGNASIMKNRIINGAMVIDQRNAGAQMSGSIAGSYTLDRWIYDATQNSKVTIQQNAGSVTPPVGFSNYLGVTSVSAYTVASGDLFNIAQYIEGFNTSDLGWGTANAKTITLSFQVYSSLTGTFGGALQNNARTQSYPFTYTISSANTWTTISVTIAGSTTGTWVGATNGRGLSLFLGLGVGSTYSATAGSWQSGDYRGATGATNVVSTNGATFYITGVQLEVGSSATGFEYVNYQTSLANCQRYYWQATYQSANTRFGTGTAAGSIVDGFQTPVPVSLRTQPTIALSNIGLYDGTTTYTISSVGTNYSNGSLVSAQLTPSASITAGKAVQLYAINSSAVISASAEL